MRYACSILALAVAALASPAPQASSGSSACAADFSGQFQVTVIKPVAKRDLEERQATCGQSGILTLKLAGGILTDAQGRTGYIASNYQFQFDKPPQPNALSTSGFGVCTNSTNLQVLSLAGSTTFYQCLSGSFYNLYNKNWAPQCSPVNIQVLPCSGSGPATTALATPGATITTGGGASGASAVTVAPEGQPQASSAAAAAPPKVTVISDGQPQAQSAIPVAQLSDGQPNMPTALVSQLGDGQPRVTGSVAPAVTTPATPISQISDGQPQAGNATVFATPTVSASIYRGAAALPTAVAEFVAIAAGAVAVAML